MKDNSSQIKNINNSAKGAIIFANIVFVISIFFTLLIIIFTINKHNFGHFYSLILIFEILIFFILSIGLIFLSNNTKFNISMMLITSAICVISFEIYLSPSNHIFKINEKKQLSQLYKTKVASVLYPGRQNENLTFNIDGKETFLLGGHSNILTMLCRERGDLASYLSDEHGFNNPEGLYNKVNTDIVSVGDSFVHGHCVSENQTMSAHIRQKYPNSINLGIGANGALLKLATLKEYAEPIRPKIVLWFYTEHTLGRFLYNYHPILIKYLDPNFSQGLFHIQSKVDNQLKGLILESTNNESNNSILIDWFQTRRFFAEIRNFIRPVLVKTFRTINESKLYPSPLYLKEIYGNLKLNDILYTYSRKKISYENYLKNSDIILHDPPQIILDEYLKILSTAKKITDAWNGQLIFVYLPTSSQYWGESDSPYSKSDHEAIINTVSKINLPVIDLFHDFQKLTCKDLWYDAQCGGHWDGLGYELAAKLILNKFEDLKLLNKGD